MLTTPQKESIELLAENKYPQSLIHSDDLHEHHSMFGIVDANYYERVAFIAGYSAALEEQKERAVKFAQWIANSDYQLAGNNWYHKEDEDGDCALSESELYNLFISTNIQ